MKSKKEVLETWFRKVWLEENKATIREMFVPEKGDGKKTAYGLKKDEGLSPEDFEQFHELLLALVKVDSITIDYSIEQVNWIMAECTLKAKSR